MKGPSVKAVFTDLEDQATASVLQEGDYAGPGTTGKAIEIEEIPLCANCIVETEADDHDTVVQKAVRRIDRADGGLARNRLERQETANRAGVRTRVHRTTGRISRLSTDSPRPHEPGASALATDGVADHDVDSDYCLVPLDSTIYVNIHDPICLPAFKPSATKPIPQWMQPPWMRTLPNQHKPSKAVDPRPRSILDDHFGDVSSVSAEQYGPSGSYTVCPTAVQTPTRVLSPQERRYLARNEECTSQSSAKEGIYDLRNPPITIPRGPNFSFVTSEPLKRPSSRMVHYNVPRITPSPLSEDLVRSSSTSPYPIPVRSTSVVPVNGRHSNPLILNGFQPPDSPSSPRSNVQERPPPPPSGVSSHSKSRIRLTPPPQSKEYLDLYKPTQRASSNVRTTTASIAVAGRGRVRRIGNWNQKQPVVEISRRDSRSKPSVDAAMGRPIQDKLPASHESRIHGAVVVNASGDLKRSSAHGDLWRLFGRGAGHEK